MLVGWWTSPPSLPVPSQMRKKTDSLARIVQPLVVLALFLIFLKLFAWEAWTRFSRDDVQVQMRKEENRSLNTPAITICLDMVRIASTQSGIEI